MVYKWCVVRQCPSTSRKTPEKLFAHVPKDPKRRKVWLNLGRRDPDSIGPNSSVYMCEDHFNMKEDMENYMKYKFMGGIIKMKQNIVPHIFDCHKDRKRASTRSSRPAAVKRARRRLVEEAIASSTSADTSTPSVSTIPSIKKLSTLSSKSKTSASKHSKQSDIVQLEFQSSSSTLDNAGGERSKVGCLETTFQDKKVKQNGRKPPFDVRNGNTSASGGNVGNMKVKIGNTFNICIIETTNILLFKQEPNDVDFEVEKDLEVEVNENTVGDLFKEAIDPSLIKTERKELNIDSEDKFRDFEIDIKDETIDYSVEERNYANLIELEQNESRSAGDNENSVEVEIQTEDRVVDNRVEETNNIHFSETQQSFVTIDNRSSANDKVTIDNHTANTNNANCKSDLYFDVSSDDDENNEVNNDSGRVKETNNINLKCSLCDQHFNNLIYLKKHILSHRCDQCDMVFDKMRKESHKCKRLYQCDICKKEFFTTKVLRTHEKTHTEKQFQCGTCKKSFFYPSRLKAHKCRETVRSEYKCDVCDQRFYYFHTFDLHKLQRDCEKKYSCNICLKDVTGQRNLIVHRRSHTTVKSYQCRRCDNGFTSLKSLSAHVSTAHKRNNVEKPCMCDV